MKLMWQRDEESELEEYKGRASQPLVSEKGALVLEDDTCTTYIELKPNGTFHIEQS